MSEEKKHALLPSLLRPGSAHAFYLDVDADYGAQLQRFRCARAWAMAQSTASTLMFALLDPVVTKTVYVPRGCQAGVPGLVPRGLLAELRGAAPGNGGLRLDLGLARLLRLVPKQNKRPLGGDQLRLLIFYSTYPPNYFCCVKTQGKRRGGNEEGRSNSRAGRHAGEAGARNLLFCVQ
eukprot:g27085.t1